jgi:Activator of Hsp90 ATPase homolog 1-like protein
MSNQSFTTTFSVDQTPQEVFDAINNVRGWWGRDVDGATDKLGEEFTYRFEDAHRSKIRVAELVPGQKVSWLVVENYFSFTTDTTEWVGTTMVFDISEKDGKTEVHFTHEGLVPAYECWDACSEGWGVYINGSLRNLITTGVGHPNAEGVSHTSAEELVSRNPG